MYLVSRAARGIGEAIVMAFAAKGATTVMTDNRQEPPGALADEPAQVAPGQKAANKIG